MLKENSYLLDDEIMFFAPTIIGLRKQGFRVKILCLSTGNYDKKGEIRFRLKAANGEIIATGEGYKAKSGCKNGIESIKKNAPEAEIDDRSAE